MSSCLALFQVAFVVLFVDVYCSAQNCPRANPVGTSTAFSVLVLTGRLVFHNDLRQWFELRLSNPVCGQKSIELVTGDKGWTALQVLRGCVVKSYGPIDIPGTGYYSLDLFQNSRKLTSVRSCIRLPPFPDYTKRRPEAYLRKYHVMMRLHYQTDGPLEVNVASGNRQLRPWQVYASYFLTGGFVYYAYCGKSFVAENPRGAAEGKPWVLDGYIAFDPESVPKGIDPIFLEYDCRRMRRGE